MTTAKMAAAEASKPSRRQLTAKMESAKCRWIEKFPSRDHQEKTTEPETTTITEKVMRKRKMTSPAKLLPTPRQLDNSEKGTTLMRMECLLLLRRVASLSLSQSRKPRRKSAHKRGA